MRILSQFIQIVFLDTQTRSNHSSKNISMMLKKFVIFLVDQDFLMYVINKTIG